jgi:hypothetical protein
MESAPRVDCAGRRRSPATVPGYHRGRPPRNQGLRHPPDPPTVEEIIAVMRAAGDDPDGIRLRGGSSCCGALGCGSAKPWSWARAIWTGPGGAIQVRHGKGGRHHEVGMDRWAWEQLDPGSTCVRGCRSARCSACCAARLADGRAQPLGFVSSCAMPRAQPGCVAGLRPISSGKLTLSRCRARACRSSSYSGNSGMPTSGCTSVYLRGIDNTEIVHAVHDRPAPVIPQPTAFDFRAKPNQSGPRRLARPTASARPGRSKAVVTHGPETPAHVFR